MGRRRTDRITRAWTGLAVVAFNTIVLFALLNLGAWLVLRLAGVAEVSRSPVYEALVDYGFDTLGRVYPGLGRDEIDGLLRESWTLELAYEPYTQFRERPVSGRWVNVTPEGYRLNGPGHPPWPPDGPSIFVFGGSTAFGYGLPDGQTFAARLEARLRPAAAGIAPAVYNFGRAYYLTGQERALFERLLAAGHSPAVALFLDGLNDTLTWPESAGEPYLTEALAVLVDRARPDVGHGAAVADEPGWREVLAGLPLVEATRRALTRLAGTGVRREAFETEDVGGAELERRARALAGRIQRERDLIRAAAGARGVEPLFVLQPVPWTGYDLSRHLFAPSEAVVASLRQRFGAYYPALAGLGGAGAIDCSSVLDGYAEPAFVDAHHYRAEAIELLVDCVAAPARRALERAAGARAAAGDRRPPAPGVD